MSNSGDGATAEAPWGVRASADVGGDLSATVWLPGLKVIGNSPDFGYGSWKPSAVLFLFCFCFKFGAVSRDTTQPTPKRPAKAAASIILQR